MKRRMRFKTWCAKNTEDERKINYRFTDAEKNIQTFTSDDKVTYSMLKRIGDAWISTVILKDDEWYADIYED